MVGGDVVSREIKFRARNAELPPCWIYGYFVNAKNCCYIVNDTGRFKVVAGTECQFTGLHDKNGKEIYEGDICNIENSVETISWNQEFCRWDTEQRDGLEEAWEIEVIGNIHEHPRLLHEVPA
jgi:hypothetical protein